MITRVVLRLYPEPCCTHAVLGTAAGYDKVLAVPEKVRRRLRLLLSAFEVMWSDYWEQATGKVPGMRAPVAIGNASHVILIEMQGLDETVDDARFASLLKEMLEEGLIADGAVTQSLADVAAFWAIRDAAAGFANPAVIGVHISFDVGLTAARMDEFAVPSPSAAPFSLRSRSRQWDSRWVGASFLSPPPLRPGIAIRAGLPSPSASSSCFTCR